MHRKRLLMIQPENSTIHRFRKFQLNNFTQISIPYLAAFVDKAQYDVTVVDEYNQKIPYHKPFDLVAISVNTTNAFHSYAIAKRLRALGAHVVLGGPHVTLLPDEAGPHCDYLIVGEGEATWPQFLDDYFAGCAKPRYTACAPPQLCGLPRPRFDLLKRRNSVMKGAVIASRGCPYQCSYCNLKQIYFDQFRTRPCKEVVDEIAALKSKHFVFWDDNLFADKAYALALMEQMRPLNKRWAAQVTIRDCDDALLRAVKQAGCIYLFVGLESFSQQSLQHAGKPVNRVDHYQSIVDRIHSNGILIQAGIVFGFDSDTPDIFRDTLCACEELGIDGVTVSVLTPFPGTPIYQQFKREQRLLHEDWTKYNGKTDVVFLPAHMTPQQLYDGYLYFRKKFYSLRSFIKRIRVSKSNLLYSAFINLGYKLALLFGT